MTASGFIETACPLDKPQKSYKHRSPDSWIHRDSRTDAAQDKKGVYAGLFDVTGNARIIGIDESLGAGTCRACRFRSSPASRPAGASFPRARCDVTGNEPIEGMEQFALMVTGLDPGRSVTISAIDHKSGQTGYVRVNVR